MKKCSALLLLLASVAVWLEVSEGRSFGASRIGRDRDGERGSLLKITTDSYSEPSSSDFSSSTLVILSVLLVLIVAVVSKVSFELYRIFISPLRKKNHCILCDTVVRGLGGKKHSPQNSGADVTRAWDAHRRHCAKLNAARLERYAPHPTAKCADCAERLRLMPVSTARKFTCARRRCGRQTENDGSNCFHCYACDADYCGACVESRESKLKRYGVDSLPGSTKDIPGLAPRLPPSVTCNPLFSAVDSAADGNVSAACKGILLAAHKTSGSAVNLAKISTNVVSSLPDSLRNSGADLASSFNGGGRRDGGGLRLLAVNNKVLRRNSSAPDLTAKAGADFSDAVLADLVAASSPTNNSKKQAKKKNKS